MHKQVFQWLLCVHAAYNTCHKNDKKCENGALNDEDNVIKGAM